MRKKAHRRVKRRTSGSIVFQQKLASWGELVKTVDYLMDDGWWMFRGHDQTEWRLKTSLEREFKVNRSEIERALLERFVRSAPRLLGTSQWAPRDEDLAAWLGLIQHYGGPTRLLDMTRSAYIALYFAFEASGNHDRALWSINTASCMGACANIMASNGSVTFKRALYRLRFQQAQVISSLVSGRPDPELGSTFTPFTGVFPLDPWKPDSRQSAQQAMFLCVGNIEKSFMGNMAAHPRAKDIVAYKFVMPPSLRQEVLGRLSMMNVTAATLFPGLDGLARSLRTLTVRPLKTDDTAS